MSDPTTIPLTYLDLTLAAGLVLIAGAVSVSLRLGLEKRLAIASVRTVVQLLLIGYVLKYVFQFEQPWAIAAVVAVMFAAASRATIDRSTRRLRGATWLSLLTLVLCGLITTWLVTGVIIGSHPWYAPRYMIPLLGMILGNSLTGVALCMDNLLEVFSQRRERLEMELALGATRWEAARGPVAEAVRKGMIPIINSMMVVGLVSLPGMMTGQILAGADPLQAVKYQIVVMFMIGAASAAGCMLISLLVFWRVFNRRHQLRAGVIQTRGKG
ncbi:MAG: iron export ABC transporter permease subunit FetB [Phycisphaeraceae bacterium]|nr:iron export ABC transporter permease subunit FetB [Phycisphaeraceae bacterium]